MIVVMKLDHTQEEAENVMNRMTDFGLRGQPIHGAVRTVIAGLGQVVQDHRDEISMMAGVDEVIRVDTDAMCAAIKDVFEDTRAIFEPSGALSIAGAKA